MKKLVYLVTLVFLATGFTSCKKIKGLFDVDVETTMSADLNIDVPDASTKSTAAYSFEAEAAINPMDYDDVADNEDKIKKITADGIIATVEYVSKENVVLLKGTTFTIKNSEKEVSWILENEWPIEEGSELTLADVADIYDEVTDILTSLDVFKVSAVGTASEKGVTITLRIDIETTVTGNPF